MRKKRIVIDASPFLYTMDGIGRGTHGLIENIVSLNQQYEILLFGRRLRGKSLKRLGFKAKTRQLRLPRLAEGMIRKANLVDVVCRGDLYHATDFYMPLARPEKGISTVHDLIFLTQPEKMIDHMRLALKTPEFLRKCRAIITVSEFSRQDIVNRLQIDPSKISVIYWGVNRELFHPLLDEEMVRSHLKSKFGLTIPYFLGVSCSTGRKNTPLLLKAYSRLLSSNPQNDLVLTWNPPPEIRLRYNSPDMKEHIHFIGRQSDQDLRCLYCGATALVYPSLYEGFGLPIVEAMCCGTPVITSNKSSLPEVGGDAAVYIDPYDEDSLVRAMEAFENRDPKLKNLQERVLLQASKYSWEKCATETLAVYARCLEE